jgi:hypothetical protein
MSTVIQDLQKQSAADFERVTNMARLRYDYQASHLEGLLRLCDHSLKLQESKLEPKGLEPKGLEPDQLQAALNKAL